MGLEAGSEPQLWFHLWVVYGLEQFLSSLFPILFL
jgi:hypothetical protein